MPKGKLKPEDYNCIRRNYRYLKENFDAERIVDFLFENGVMSWEDKEKIGNKKSQSKRNEKLLKFILHAGPGDAFGVFLKSLVQEHMHVLNHLKRSQQEEKDKTLKKYNSTVQKVSNEKDDEKRQNIFIAIFQSIHIHKHGDNDEVTTEIHKEYQCLALTDSGNGTYQAHPTSLPAVQWK